MYAETDETHSFRRKYHRGRHKRGFWVVGTMERATGRCWLERICRRDAPTPERTIAAHVLPGSIIVTDAWGGYNNASTINNGVYDHQVVGHAQNFVCRCLQTTSRVLPLSVQCIMISTLRQSRGYGRWMHAKRKIRYQSGISRNLFLTDLAEFQ